LPIRSSTPVVDWPDTIGTSSMRPP
jgi:hypothetical protein